MMILGFGAQNFHSFYEPVEISLIAPSKLARQVMHHNSISGDKISKLTAFIGPNGSGKTTLLKIPAFISWFIANSFNDIPAVEGVIPIAPHFAHGKEDTKVWMTFELDSQIWKYELVCNSKKVISETLFRKTERYSYVFSRTWNSNTQKYVVKQKDFGFPSKEISKIRENVSFVSTAAQYGVEFASRIAGFFQTSMRSNVTVFGRLHSLAGFEQSSKYYAENDMSTKKMQEMLKSWDFGLAGVQMHEVTINLPESVQKRWIPIGVHKVDGEEFKLSFEFESGGTRSAYILLAQIIPVLEKGGIAVIDEIEAELHPNVLNEILSLFLMDSTNPEKAQLIFTTHAIQVIDRLDKNQIIFTEKQPNQTSEAFALSEIKGVRPDENYLAKYKAGAYGALPTL